MWLSQFHVVFSAIRFLPRSSMSSICPTSVRTRKVTTTVHLRRTMHDTPQEQPPRSLLKWKGVDQDGQSWVAIAICLSHTHARTLYTHARAHALTPRTHMHASCMHAHTHTPTHASTLTSPALRQVQTAVSKATTHGRLPAALGSWSCIHVPRNMPNQMYRSMYRSRQLGVRKRAVKLTPRDRS